MNKPILLALSFTVVLLPSSLLLRGGEQAEVHSVPLSLDERLASSVSTSVFEGTVALADPALPQDRQQPPDGLRTRDPSVDANGDILPARFQDRPDQELRRRVQERLARVDDREHEASLALVHTIMNVGLDIDSLEDASLRDLADEFERLERVRDADLLDLQSVGEPATMEEHDLLDRQMLEIESRSLHLGETLVESYRSSDADRSAEAE